MKPFLSPNYTVFIRSQIDEEIDNVAHFYDRVYFIDLNQLVSIHFVPWINDFVSRKILLPNNLDNPPSIDKARLWLLNQVDYLVTYQNDQAGHIWEVEINFENSDKVRNCILYCVTQEAFDHYIHELKQIATQMKSVHSYHHYEDVKNFKVIRYLEDTVLGSVLVKPNHFEVLQRPFEHLMSLCVQALNQHNATQFPTIYHGRFEQFSFLSTYVEGNEKYECGLFCSKHCMVDKRFLPAIGVGREFWSFHKSIKRDDNFRMMMAYGVSIWPDKNDHSLLQLELFKIWREIDICWWPFDAPEGNDKVEPDYRERLTFNINEINLEAFVMTIIEYVSGKNIFLPENSQ